LVGLKLTKTWQVVGGPEEAEARLPAQVVLVILKSAPIAVVRLTL
jgi:hypothetical protein